MFELFSIKSSLYLIPPVFFTALNIPAHLYIPSCTYKVYLSWTQVFIYLHLSWGLKYNPVNRVLQLLHEARVLSPSPHNLGMVVHGFSLQYWGGRSKKIRSHMSFPRYIHAKIRRWQELFETLSQSKNKQQRKPNKTKLIWIENTWLNKAV